MRNAKQQKAETYNDPLSKARKQKDSHHVKACNTVDEADFDLHTLAADFFISTSALCNSVDRSATLVLGALDICTFIRRLEVLRMAMLLAFAPFYLGGIHSGLTVALFRTLTIRRSFMHVMGL